MSAPLAGIVVLDLTRVLTGPYCTTLLGDLGARVIKVERPGRGDEYRGALQYQGRSTSDEDFFYSANRSKASVAIDMKSATGRDLLVHLSRKSDVLVENFTPGVAERLGLGYEQLRTENPGLVYCSISGFGNRSPYRNRRAYDTVLQAMSGVMSVTGVPGGIQMRAGLMFADLSAALYSLFAIVGALYQRNETGVGQYIDIALADTLASLWGVDAAGFLAGGPVPGPHGDRLPTEAPAAVFGTADGQRIWIEATDASWPALATLVGRADWALDRSLATSAARLVRRRELDAAVVSWAGGSTADQCIAGLVQAAVPHAPVHNLAAALSDPHAEARDLLFSMHHLRSGTIRQIRSPFRFDGQPVTVVQPPPLLGHDAYPVLQEVVGLTSAEIDDLIHQGVVGAPDTGADPT